MEQRDGEIRLLEASPGCSVLSIASPRHDRPLMQMLVEALAAWRSKFPTRFVTELEVVRLGGAPNMLCIQWQEVVRPPFTCDVLASVRQKYGQEYIEALATDALRVTEQYPNDFPVTAMLSKREAVVVMVKRKNTC